MKNNTDSRERDYTKMFHCPVCKEKWTTGSKEIGSWLEQHYYYHKLENMRANSVDVKLEALKLQGQHEKNKGY